MRLMSESKIVETVESDGQSLTSSFFLISCNVYNVHNYQLIINTMKPKIITHTITPNSSVPISRI